VSDATPSPPASRARDHERVEQEYGVQKWPAVERLIDERSSGEGPGGTALARVAQRRGAREGYGASAAAMIETVAILGPPRFSVPLTQAATAPMLGRLEKRAVAPLVQVAACAAVRVLLSSPSRSKKCSAETVVPLRAASCPTVSVPAGASAMSPLDLKSC